MYSGSDVALSDEPARTVAELPDARLFADWYSPCKAAVDIALATVLMVLSAPLMILSAAVVKLTSRGPAIYTQTRLGLDGRPFTIYKIRTMTQDAEVLTGPRWSVHGDPRVTPVGRLLRRTHLDELPQLWNVLRGEMSLIGPRPERPEFVVQLERAIPRYRRRLSVRPGVTGLAQVQLPPDTDLESVRNKLAYDLYYVRHGSPLLDLKIILGTACHVLHVPPDVTRRLLVLPTRDAIENEA